MRVPLLTCSSPQATNGRMFMCSGFSHISKTLHLPVLLPYLLLRSLAVKTENPNNDHPIVLNTRTWTAVIGTNTFIWGCRIWIEQSKNIGNVPALSWPGSSLQLMAPMPGGKMGWKERGIMLTLRFYHGQTRLRGRVTHISSEQGPQCLSTLTPGKILPQSHRRVKLLPEGWCLKSRPEAVHHAPKCSIDPGFWILRAEFLLGDVTPIVPGSSQGFGR